MNTSASLLGEEAAGSHVASDPVSFSPSLSTPPLLEESWQHYQDRAVLSQGHLLTCNWVDIPVQDPLSCGIVHSIQVYSSFCLTCLLSTENIIGDMKTEQSCNWLDAMSESTLSCGHAHNIQAHLSVGDLVLELWSAHLVHLQLWECTQRTRASVIWCT